VVLSTPGFRRKAETVPARSRCGGLDEGSKIAGVKIAADRYVAALGERYISHYCERLEDRVDSRCVAVAEAAAPPRSHVYATLRAKRR